MEQVIWAHGFTDLYLKQKERRNINPKYREKLEFLIDFSIDLSVNVKKGVKHELEKSEYM